MRITPALLYLFSTACLFSGETNSKKTHLLESSKTEASINIPLANRPGVQRTTPWEKKQFPVKNADGSTYFADGYQATFTGFDKMTRWKIPQVNLIFLLPSDNEGKIWFGSKLGTLPVHFFDTGNEIIACIIENLLIFWEISLLGNELQPKDFEPTDANMDNFVEKFFPDFSARTNYRRIYLNDLIPLRSSTLNAHAVGSEHFSKKIELVGVASKEEYAAFLLRDLENPELKARFWLKLRPGKILGLEIFRRPVDEDVGKNAIFSKIPIIKRSPRAQRITPWAKKQFQVLDVNGGTYAITGYLAAFNGINLKFIEEPINIIFLFDEKRPGKIWTGMSDDPVHFIDTGKEIVGCWLFRFPMLTWDSSVELNEVDKKNLEPTEENIDSLIKSYYPGYIFSIAQNFKMDDYFPKITEYTSFSYRNGAGTHDDVELKEIKAKDGKFGFFLQNMARPHVKGWLWIQFPEARVVKTELDEETLKTESSETRSIEVRTNNPLTSSP